MKNAIIVNKQSAWYQSIVKTRYINNFVSKFQLTCDTAEIANVGIS
jgi:hypothetical protein